MEGASRAAASRIRRFATATATAAAATGSAASCASDIMEAAARAAASRFRRFATAPATGSATSYGSDVMEAATRAAASRFRRFATAPATGSAASYGSDVMEAATRAAGSRIQRLATATAACSAATYGSAVMEAGARPAASRIRRFATSVTTVSRSDVRQIKPPMADLPTRFERSEYSAATSTSYRQINPTYRPFPVLARHAGITGSVSGLRSFGSIPGQSAPTRVLGPSKKIIEYKPRVINPERYEPEHFAKHVMNPMMKLPHSVVRILAADVDSFFTPTENGKPLFNSYRQIFFDLHRQRLSIAKPVSISDFEIVESYHEYRMEGETLVEEILYKFVLKEGTPLCRSNRKTVRENYKEGAGVLREFIAYTCDSEVAPLAQDLELSLKNMEDPSFPKGYLSFVDPTFLLLDDRGEAYLDVFDLLNSDKMPKSESVLILDGVLPKDWDEDAKGNELMKNWYEFKEKGYYKKANPWSFLSLLRHVNRHPFLYFKTSFGRYSKAELQRLIQIKYPKVMHKLYFKLFARGYLKKLGAHRFFRLH